MIFREAACACGGLRARCAGAPLLVSACHCLACQRRTGSAFGVAVFYERSAVEIAGATRAFRRASDAGSELVFHFCPTCGTTLYWEPARKPDQIAIALGAFADPGFPAPSKAVHLDTAHPWAHLPAFQSSTDA